MLLFALGIMQVGHEASKALAEHFRHSEQSAATVEVTDGGGDIGAVTCE
jgi:NAD-dependent DNA ligase